MSGGLLTAGPEPPSHDLSRSHLPVGKIITAILVVIVPVVWWAATLSADVRAVSRTLGEMKASVEVAAGIAKELEQQAEDHDELKLRVDVLYSRVDSLRTAEEARRIAARADN